MFPPTEFGQSSETLWQVALSSEDNFAICLLLLGEAWDSFLHKVTQEQY
jgi:hypothetical protein